MRATKIGAKFGRCGVGAVALVLAVGAAFSQGTQNKREAEGKLINGAIKAYQAKKYSEFLALEKRALALDPENPRVIYNVACGESLQGNAKEAVRRLNGLTTRKLDLGAEADGDFEGIRKTPEWAEYAAKLAELRRTVVAKSSVAFTLADPQLVATGIAYDAKTGDIFVASVRERKIVKREKTGAISDFVREGQDGFLSGASLAIDSRRGILYASTSAAPYMRGYSKADFGKTGVFAFDLKTGKTLRKVWLEAKGQFHFLNALAIDHQGTVYVSDSGEAGIYRWAAEGDTLERFLGVETFGATQGLAFSEDEKTLYVAEYSNGVWAVDIATKQARQIPGPDGVWLGNLDGLARAQEELIAVQIQVKPERVLRLKLDQKSQKFSSVEILEFNRPDYQSPIQGAVADGAFLYVANSQLDLGNGRTGEFAAERAKPTIVLKLPL